MHKGFDKDSDIQTYVNYAYQLGGIEFVKMLECENEQRKLDSRGDGGKSLGLCQLHGTWHKEIFEKKFVEDWKYQLHICFQKWNTGTKFYGPTRIINGQDCKEYVQDRFYFINK